MPKTLGIWEWGCPKRGDAHITVTGALERRLPLLHDFKSLVTFSSTLYRNCAVEAHILRYLPYVNSIDQPNFRPKTDTRSPRNKFRFQTWVSVGAISVILWTSNLSGFEN